MTQKTGNDCGNSLYLVCYQLMRTFQILTGKCRSGAEVYGKGYRGETPDKNPYHIDDLSERWRKLEHLMLDNPR